MANTVENTFRKIGDTIEYMFGDGKVSQPSTNQNSSGSESPLERFGTKIRADHLIMNEWRKNIQYTRALVNAEYMIQTEFKVDGGGEDVIVEKVPDGASKKAMKARKERNDKRKENNQKPAEIPEQMAQDKPL